VLGRAFSLSGERQRRGQVHTSKRVCTMICGGLPSGSYRKGGWRYRESDLVVRRAFVYQELVLFLPVGYSQKSVK
jgi:hypothetical protein